MMNAMELREVNCGRFRRLEHLKARGVPAFPAPDTYDGLQSDRLPQVNVGRVGFRRSLIDQHLQAVEESEIIIGMYLLIRSRIPGTLEQVVVQVCQTPVVKIPDHTFGQFQRMRKHLTAFFCFQEKQEKPKSSAGSPHIIF